MIERGGGRERKIQLVFRDKSKAKIMPIVNVFIIAFNFGTCVNSFACFGC